MKKFLVCILCLLMFCAIPFSVSAEETTDSVIETTETVEETTGTSAITPPAETPSVDEMPTVDETPEEDLTVLLSEKFEEWVVPNIEEISVIITLIGTLFYQIRKNKLLSKTIGTMNNNTITIAEQNAGVMNKALTGMESTALAVKGYDERIAALLQAHASAVEDKERIEKELTEVKAYLKTAAESNIEFANELAELLGLANIPNYKKEEIGARHLAAVKSIKAAETEALNAVQEVNTDVGEEA